MRLLFPLYIFTALIVGINFAAINKFKIVHERTYKVENMHFISYMMGVNYKRLGFFEPLRQLYVDFFLSDSLDLFFTLNGVMKYPDSQYKIYFNYGRKLKHQYTEEKELYNIPTIQIGINDKPKSLISSESIDIKYSLSSGAIARKVFNTDWAGGFEVGGMLYSSLYRDHVVAIKGYYSLMALADKNEIKMLKNLTPSISYMYGPFKGTAHLRMHDFTDRDKISYILDCDMSVNFKNVDFVLGLAVDNKYNTKPDGTKISKLYDRSVQPIPYFSVSINNYIVYNNLMLSVYFGLRYDYSFFGLSVGGIAY